MKKLLSLIFALLLTCTVLSSCKKNTDVPEGMILASGESADYYLYIPDDWTVDLQTGATTAHVSSNDRSNVGAYSWMLEHTDDTVDTWHSQQLTDLEAGFANYTEESVRELTLDGVYAKEYVFTANLGAEARKYRQVAAVKEGYVYVVTYSSSPEFFDEHNSDFDDIIDQFRFR